MRELDTWEINIKTKLTFHNVKITYPEGLNSMIKMFRLESYLSYKRYINFVPKKIMLDFIL